MIGFESYNWGYVEPHYYDDDDNPLSELSEKLDAARNVAKKLVDTADDNESPICTIDRALFHQLLEILDV